MSDRLTLADAIEDAGIPREKATRIASVVFDAIHQNVATQADLQNTEARLGADLRQVEARLSADLTRLGADLRQVETRLSAEITRIADRTLIRLSGVMVVLLGILFAALRLHS